MSQGGSSGVRLTGKKHSFASPAAFVNGKSQFQDNVPWVEDSVPSYNIILISSLTNFTLYAGFSLSSDWLVGAFRSHRGNWLARMVRYLGIFVLLDLPGCSVLWNCVIYDTTTLFLESLLTVTKCPSISYSRKDATYYLQIYWLHHSKVNFFIY